MSDVTAAGLLHTLEAVANAVESLTTENTELRKEVERLRAVVYKMPRDRNGVLLTPGTKVQHPFGWGIIPGVVGNGPIELIGGELVPVNECVVDD